MSTAELTADKRVAYEAFIEAWTALQVFSPAGPSMDMKSAWQLWLIAWRACEQQREADGV